MSYLPEELEGTRYYEPKGSGEESPRDSAGPAEESEP
jgi:hypothetical protein